MRTTTIDAFFNDGCGRCALGGTPACKVNNWREVLFELHLLALDSGLKVEMKWGVPCYTLDGKNVALLGVFKESCVLSFFKGELLPDPEQLLEKPGPNAQSGRVLRITHLSQIATHKIAIAELLKRAIEVEKQGIKPPKQKVELTIPEELQNAFANDPVFEAAFYNLTPGRQRSHILFISGAKQSATRVARVQKCMPKVFSGRGFNEYE
jgi:uncharacterized protein YdeI (YjbR/CyaY-like superfamily)